MAFGSAEKKAVVEKFQQSSADTGSTQVQVALLTKKIANLTEHLKQFRGDVHSRHGLIKLVSKRRRLLNYIKNKNHQAYAGLVSELGLRK